MHTIIIATRNAHKVGEIREILGKQFRFLTLNDFPGAPKTIEDADSFSGNAAKKSIELANWISARGMGVPPVRFESEDAFVLADDSGLEVDALNGAPGIFSARFADMNGDGNSPDAANNEKLMRLLKDVPAEKRTARFRCVIALTPILFAESENTSPVCYADEAELRTEVFDGTCEGKIAVTWDGRGGFGYDPLFIPNGFEQSFEEIRETEKNKISHRARALEKLRKRFG